MWLVGNVPLSSLSASFKISGSFGVVPMLWHFYLSQQCHKVRGSLWHRTGRTGSQNPCPFPRAPRETHHIPWRILSYKTHDVKEGGSKQRVFWWSPPHLPCRVYWANYICGAAGQGRMSRFLCYEQKKELSDCKKFWDHNILEFLLTTRKNFTSHAWWSRWVIMLLFPLPISLGYFGR